MAVTQEQTLPLHVLGRCGVNQFLRLFFLVPSGGPDPEPFCSIEATKRSLRPMRWLSLLFFVLKATFNSGLSEPLRL